MQALVLPAEMAAHPDVGPAVAAVGLADAPLEGVVRAVGVGLGGLGLVQQLAQVEEMLLAGAPLGELRPPPLGDELLRGQDVGPQGIRLGKQLHQDVEVGRLARPSRSNA